MEFYRAVGQAEVGPVLQHVIATWWGQAMLDTDPDRDWIIAAVQEGGNNGPRPWNWTSAL